MFKISFFYKKNIIENGVKKSVLLIAISSAIINFLNVVIAFYSMQIFDKVLASSSVETLIYITLFTLLLIFFLNFFYNLRYFFNQKLIDNYTKKTFRRLSQLSDLSQKILVVENFQKVKNYLNSPLSLAIFEVPFSLTYLMAIFLIHPAIALYGLMVIFFLIFIEKFLQQKTNFVKNNFQEQHEEFSKIFSEICSINSASINIFRAENLFNKWQYESKKYIETESKYYEANNHCNYLNKHFRLLAQIFSTMICAYLVIKNQISVGSIIVVSILLSRLLEPFASFFYNLKLFQNFLIDLCNLKLILNKDLLLKNNIETKIETKILNNFQSLSFDKVFYREPNNKNNILQIDDLQILPNTIIALYANSKFESDSLFNLILRNINPNYGNIGLNDTQIDKIPINQLKKFVEIIEENPCLNVGNILENLARMNNKYDADDVVKYIENSGFATIIKNTQNGYLTDISMVDCNLKYLIGFLSVLYGQSPLIFVQKIEDKNHIPDFQNKIYHLLEDYKNKKSATIIVTNPKLNFIKKCHKVAIFKDGKLNIFSATEFIQNYAKTHQYNS